MKTPEKCKEKQQLMAAEKSAFTSSQRAIVQQLTDKCIPVLRSASRAGRGWSKTGGRAFLEEAKGGGRLRCPHAAQPRRPAPASPPGRAATGRPGEKAEKEAAGPRPSPAARTAASAPLPSTRARPRVPRPRASPATKKDKSTTNTAMAPRRPQQCRATRSWPAGRQRPPPHEWLTSSGSPRLPTPAPSSPPLGRLQPSPPIASYAAACGRDEARETSASRAEPNVMDGRPCQWQAAIEEPGSSSPGP